MCVKVNDRETVKEMFDEIRRRGVVITDEMDNLGFGSADALDEQNEIYLHINGRWDIVNKHIPMTFLVDCKHGVAVITVAS